MSILGLIYSTPPKDQPNIKEKKLKQHEQQLLTLQAQAILTLQNNI